MDPIALSIVDFVMLGVIVFLLVLLWCREKKYKNQLDDQQKSFIAKEKKTKNEQEERYLVQLNEICKKRDQQIVEQSEHIQQLKQILSQREELFEQADSNLSAIPYMASLIADYKTHELGMIAASLDWGSDQKRAKKVQDIRIIRENAKQQIEQYKQAQYQLDYLLVLFPGLQDVIECDYKDLPNVALEVLKEREPLFDYLSKEEFNDLSTTERNQLALDRYIQGRSKTKWQIGRDYELYIGYMYSQKGASVEYFGSFMGKEDLGRDLIVKKQDGHVLIVQCKYWGSGKMIHEKHITQLYGTTVSYCIEHNCPIELVKGVLITNTCLSDMAKKMADHLGIKYVEKKEIGDFPRIKCNNGQNGKIYHLPFDQQYDRVKMLHEDDFWATTVKEAEEKGYRRANKWLGT